jgi:hypothetical protein
MTQEVWVTPKEFDKILMASMQFDMSGGVRSDMINVCKDLGLPVEMMFWNDNILVVQWDRKSIDPSERLHARD